MLSAWGKKRHRHQSTTNGRCAFWRTCFAPTSCLNSLGHYRVAPVMFRRNQQEQSDAADDSEGRTVIEHGRMADPIPKQPGDDTGHELQQAHGGAVPADPAGAQMLRHEIRCKGFADGTKYPLIQSVKQALTATRRTLIMSITTERKQLMTIKTPPHPGLVVLQECIEPSGLTITRAAEALGVTRNTLSELTNGKRGISPEMAVRLSKVFGGAEEGWLVQQAQYDLAQVRRDRLKLRRLKVA